MTQLSVVENKVPGEAAKRLEDIAKSIETVQATAIIKIGEKLSEARDLFRYDRSEGGFTGWVERRLRMHERTAYRMIDVYERLGGSLDNYPNIQDLSREALFQLAAPSTSQEVRDQVEQLLIDGHKVTAADVKRMKAELEAASSQSYDIRDKAEKAVARAYDAEAEAEAAAIKAQKLEARLKKLEGRTASDEDEIASRIEKQVRQEISAHTEKRVLELSEQNRALRDEAEALKRRLEKLMSPEPAEEDGPKPANVFRLPPPDTSSDDPMNDTDPTTGKDAWHQIGGSLAIMLNTTIDAPEFWRISHQYPMSRDAMRDMVFRGLTMLAKLAEGYDQ